MQLRFVTLVLKYVNCHIFEGLVATSKLCFILNSGDEIKSYTVSSVSSNNINLPTRLYQRFCAFLYATYIFINITIVGIDRELMCAIQFQTFLTFPDLPDAIF